jgi:hypothetical protein
MSVEVAIEELDVDLEGNRVHGSLSLDVVYDCLREPDPLDLMEANRTVRAICQHYRAGEHPAWRDRKRQAPDG